MPAESIARPEVDEKMSGCRARLAPAPLIHPAEGAAAAAVSPQSTSIGALLTSHVLRDGELILLILKPSFWFVPFTSALFSGAVLLLAAAMSFVRPHHDRDFFEMAAVLIAARLMWSMLQWMGRLYILTDMRILRVSGVFSVDIFDCPLRKVVRTRMVSPFREKVAGVGSIEIIPRDETMPTAIWQTVAKPLLVQEQLVAAINRARQAGTGSE